jgi:AAA15 family ATPase/GTPase
VRRLVELFHSPSLNPKGAQLIFTTHDTSLLDPTLFRRDQIWFIEKDKEHASKLYPLSDFSPRKNEAFEKGYLIGRYGAIPFFDEWDGVDE